MSSSSAPHFKDPEKARELLEKIRWPEGAFCPHCGRREKAYRIRGRSARPGLYKCGDCKKQFTVTVGTFFERSKIPLHCWLCAVRLYCSSKKGFSAQQLHRILGVTYKTAWAMARHIQAAIEPGPFEEALRDLLDTRSRRRTSSQSPSRAVGDE